MSSFKLMAKTDGKTTLEQHIRDCIQVAEHFWDSNYNVIKKWCDRHNFNFDGFKSNLDTAIHYHDFGKGTKQWQDQVEKENPSFPPHAPYAGYFVALETKDLPAILAAISHHSLLTNNTGNKYSEYLNVEFFKEELIQLNKLFERTTKINFKHLPQYFNLDNS